MDVEDESIDWNAFDIKKSLISTGKCTEVFFISKSGNLLFSTPTHIKEVQKKSPKKIFKKFSKMFTFNSETEKIISPSLEKPKKSFLEEEYFEKGFYYNSNHFIIIKKSNTHCIALTKRKLKGLVLFNVPFGVVVCFFERPNRLEHVFNDIYKVCKSLC